MIEVLLWRDPIALRLRETDSRLDRLEAVDEARNISDIEQPGDRTGVRVAEFRAVPEPEESEKLRELPVSESPEKLATES